MGELAVPNDPLSGCFKNCCACPGPDQPPCDQLPFNQKGSPGSSYIGDCWRSVTVSDALANCCSIVGCTQNLTCAGLSIQCGENCTECTSIPAFMSDPSISDTTKSAVMNDLTSLFGITLTDIQSPNYTQNTAFRNRQTVSNTLAYYTSLGQNETFAYINLIANYRPTTLTVSRIKSEFAFDRMLLPIEYT